MGFGNVCNGYCVLCDRDLLREGVQSAGEEGAGQMIEPVLLVLVIVVLMAYLIFALLRPEKF